MIFCKLFENDILRLQLVQGPIRLKYKHMPLHPQTMLSLSRTRGVERLIGPLEMFTYNSDARLDQILEQRF